MRNLKLLGCSLGMLFALTALSVPAAQALKFTASGYPVIYTGEKEGSESENYFEFAGLKVQCKSMTMSGTATAAVEMLTVTPGYSECSSSLGSAVTIDANGCDFTLYANAEFTPDSLGGLTWLTCPIGKSMQMTTGFCTIDIAGQGPLAGLGYTNVTASSDLTVDVEVAKLTYTVTNVFICPLALGTAQNGTYVSKLTFRGFQDVVGAEGSQTSIHVH